MNELKYWLEKKVLETIQTHTMFEKNDRVLIAVSGGIDSMCLLYMLNNLKNNLKIEIFVAHFNHQLRKESSMQDAEFVKRVCSTLDIKYFLGKNDVLSGAKDMSTSLENAARKFRYDFFSKVCLKNSLSKIATAHNKCDQAETVLMRIMRGSGIDGLAGIKYVREDKVVRPFLDLTREEIKKYSKINAISFVEDETNLNLSFLRNSVRHELVPIIVKKYNPNIIATLSSLAKDTQSDSNFLNKYSDRVYEKIAIEGKKGISFDIRSFKFLDSSIQIRLIKKAVYKILNVSEFVSSGKNNFNRAQINQILKMIYSEENYRSNICKDLNIEIQYGSLTFSKYLELTEIEDYEFEVDVELNQKYILKKIGKNVFFFLLNNQEYNLKKGEMVVDYDKIKEKKMLLRSYKKGDKIALYKDGSGKKINKFFIDLKIKRGIRKNIPLLCAGSEIIALVGVRVSEIYKASSNTKNKLLIRCENI